MEDEEKFLRVLGISVIALTKLFLKDMIEAKQGKIMMISSVAAFAPPSSIQTLYGPIKTFINRFSEGLNLGYNSYGLPQHQFVLAIQLLIFIGRVVYRMRWTEYRLL
jgi:short-subunit dehydrogenase